MNLNHTYRYAILFMAAFSLFMPTVVTAETATFDSLSEGAVGAQLDDGEITFSELDNGIDILDPVFAIETEDGTLASPPFSRPNGLTATAFGSAGSPSEPQADGLGYGAVKSLSMNAGEKEADSADMDVYILAGAYSVNTVTLQALNNGTEVGSVSVVIKDVGSDHFVLSLDETALDGNTFDTLRLSSSPNPQSLMLDNVTINTVDVEVCACDVDGNGRCDNDDYRAFGQDWRNCDNAANSCRCDVDDNGRCDNDDYRAFGQDWRRAECQ